MDSSSPDLHNSPNICWQNGGKRLYKPRSGIVTLPPCPTEKVVLPPCPTDGFKLRMLPRLSLSWGHLLVSLLCWRRFSASVLSWGRLPASGLSWGCRPDLPAWLMLSQWLPALLRLLPPLYAQLGKLCRHLAQLDMSLYLTVPAEDVTPPLDMPWIEEHWELQPSFPKVSPKGKTPKNTGLV